MMSATAKTLLRLLDAERITLEQIAETAKWLPYKQEVMEELERRKAVG